MNRSRFAWLRSLIPPTLSFMALFSSVIGIFDLSVSFGQEDLTSNKRTVLDAVRAVDSPIENLEWVVAFLEKRVEENSEDSLANCVLAITHFRTQAFDQAKQSFERANSGNSAKNTRATNGKFQLLCAINTEDGATATALFQNLLNACQRESTPPALRKSFCEWMGEVIGVLDSDEAQSPIELELLAKAKKALLGIEETKLSQAFENQYSMSHSKADEIKKALLQYAEVGDAGMKEVDRTLSDELEKLEEILAAAVKESKELSSENQAAVKSLRLEMVSIREQIRRIAADWEKNAPGMPPQVFPPVGPPPIPIRDAIYVNPFYSRNVTETINNQQVTRQVQERRNYREIEADRSVLYQNQMNLYQTKLNNFNFQSSLYNQYKKDRADWNKRDEERRNKLTEQRISLEEQNSQLKVKLDALEDVKKDKGGGNADLRHSIAQLKAEQESIRKVLNSAKSGKPHLALRPMTIAPWLLTEEKNFLLKQYAEKK